MNNLPNVCTAERITLRFVNNEFICSKNHTGRLPPATPNMKNYCSNTQRPQIVEYKNANPKLTLGKIGKHFGLTRQRIYQILQAEQCPTERTLKAYKCRKCGAEFNQTLTHKSNIHCPKHLQYRKHK
jgi:hypothetical protein